METNKCYVNYDHAVNANSVTPDVSNAQNYTGTPTSTSSYTWSGNYCWHRLPCGYCKMLDRPCPMQGYQYTPGWQSPEITCRSTED